MKIVTTIVVIVISFNTYLLSQHSINGLIPPKPEEKDYFPEPEPLVAGDFQNLPNKIDLNDYYPIPPAGDQGAENSCVAWTICYAVKTMYEADENQWEITESTGDIVLDRVFSPSFMFNSLSEGPCKGLEFKKALSFIMNIGAVSLKDFDIRDDCKNRPNLNILREKAFKYRIESVFKIFKEYYSNKKIDVDEVKFFLSQGYPIILGVELDSHWDQNNSKFKSELNPNGLITWDKYLNDRQRTYHAMLCVGYSEINGSKVFKVLNSFGSKWGDGGYLWITYEVFEKAIREAHYLKDVLNILDSYNLEEPKEENEKEKSSTSYGTSANSVDTIKINSWLKENYYRNYNNEKLRLILRGIDKNKNIVEFQVKDGLSENLEVITNLQLKIGESVSFVYDDALYKITFKRFTIKGWKIWNPAVEYDIEISLL